MRVDLAAATELCIPLSDMRRPSFVSDLSVEHKDFASMYADISREALICAIIAKMFYT
jgi:hypothetical protein